MISVISPLLNWKQQQCSAGCLNRTRKKLFLKKPVKSEGGLGLLMVNELHWGFPNLAIESGLKNRRDSHRQGKDGRLRKFYSDTRTWKRTSTTA